MRVEYCDYVVGLCAPNLEFLVSLSEKEGRGKGRGKGEGKEGSFLLPPRSTDPAYGPACPVVLSSRWLSRVKTDSHAAANRPQCHGILENSQLVFTLCLPRSLTFVQCPLRHALGSRPLL